MKFIDVLGEDKAHGGHDQTYPKSILKSSRNKSNMIQSKSIWSDQVLERINVQYEEFFDPVYIDVKREDLHAVNKKVARLHVIYNDGLTKYTYGTCFIDVNPIFNKPGHWEVNQEFEIFNENLRKEKELDTLGYFWVQMKFVEQGKTDLRPYPPKNPVTNVGKVSTNINSQSADHRNNQMPGEDM